MKILILQEIIPVYRKRLFDFFASRYPDIQLTVASTSDINQSSLPNNIRYKCFIAKKIKGFGFFKLNLKKEISEYDVVIIMFDIRWISPMALLFFNRKCRLLLWGHGYSNNSSEWVLKIRRFLAAKADGIIFYDDFRKRIFSNSTLLLKKSFTAKNTLVVSNHGFSSNSERNSILFVGRINKFKQVDDLLNAFISISDQLSPEIELVIVGDGECKSSLIEIANASGLQNITISDAIYEEEEIKSLYDKAIVSVIPGTVGLGIVTSFAYGVPIVYAKERFHGPEINYANSDNSFSYDGTVGNLGEQLLEIINSDDLLHKSQQAYLFYKEHLLPENWANEFKVACLTNT